MYTFCGIGIMGKEMATRLLERNYQLTLYNRTRLKAEKLAQAYDKARVAASAVDAVENAKVIFVMLSNDPANEDFFLHPEHGIASKIKPGQSVINLSTISPALSVKISENIQGNYLEAPVAGSRVPAQKGELIVMTGGPQNMHDEYREFFEIWAKKSVYCGKIGEAAKYKLVNNLIMCISLGALAEGLSLAEQLSLDLDTLDEVIHSGAFANPMFALKEKAMRSSNYETHFPLEHARKDVSYALELAQRELPLSQETLKLYRQAEEQSKVQEDFSSIYRFYHSS